MARRYQILDVFTSHALAGNPLAIVLDSDGLDTARMQAIAAEFNLSETVFVLPAETKNHSARIRIFTPVYEMPFAGHPTVGTAICLAAERFGPVDREMDAVIVLEENIGPVRCGVRLTAGSGFAEFDIPKLPQPCGKPGGKAEIAAALGLERELIGFENHRPTVWSAGVPFCMVPVANMAALAACTVHRQHWQDAFETEVGREAGPAFVYTRETEGHDHAFRARMFSPGAGIAEDPATGSAVAAFSGVVNDFDALTAGTHVMMIEQGFEMGRPSLIRLEIVVERGAITTVRIGGHAVCVAEGTLYI